jgi:hypothetical protein
MNLYIELDDLKLEFEIADNPIARLWLDRMAVRNQYPLDHPDRFYGFNLQQEEESRSLSMIHASIETINKYSPVIERQIDSVYDQDTLNYLHNIFERYHGLLNQQNHDFFVRAPTEVKRALADLNINVHRCESVSRGCRPRFVCTWYGLPKTEHLSQELIQQYGEYNPEFGSVCLNYCEIGKTLEDLTLDNDAYIGDDAFQPFKYYSADFNVRFFKETDEQVATKISNMREYYQKHSDFFYNRGYTKFEDPRLMPLKFVVAKLINTMPHQQLIDEIKKRQHITKVSVE